MEFWRLLAHKHWITIWIFGSELRLCARCTGYVFGFLSLMIFREFFWFPFFHNVGPHIQLLICYLTVMPIAYDWLTQSWGWRESNNALRLLTGSIIGVGLSLLSQIDVNFYLKILLCSSTAAIILFMGCERAQLLKQAVENLLQGTPQ